MASENETGVRSFTAGEALAENRRVKINSSNAAVYADAQDDHIGVTVGAAASGSAVAVKLKSHPGTIRVECSGAVVSGAPVYGTDDGKVDDAYTGGGRQIGIALETGTGSGSIIEVQPEAGGSTLIYNGITRSAAAGASVATEFTFDTGTVTIPAGEIRAGDLFRVRAKGSHPTTNSSDTVKMRLYVGTEKICESANPDAVNDDVFIIDALIAITVAGASGKLVASGYTMNDALAAGLATPFALAEASEDLSGPVAIEVRGLWSAAAANESRLDQFSVERIRR